MRDDLLSAMRQAEADTWKCPAAAALLAEARQAIEGLERDWCLLGDELETVSAERNALADDRDSWREQAGQRVADWGAMRLERDVLRADAMRYRWLKGNMPPGTFGDFDVFDANSWDAAIDASLKEP